MKKSVSLLFLFIGFFLCISGGWQFVKAAQKMSIEKQYYELGYKSLSNAIQETEAYYKTNLVLPKKLPPLDFSHSFGRFSKENENLEIEYLNEKKHLNYIINIFPAKYSNKLLPFSETKITLKDGTQAYYSISGMDEKSVMTLVFKENNWTYMLSIQESLIDNPLSILEGIANSI